MRIGINGSGHMDALHSTIKGAEQAAADGFATYWLAQIFGVDALTAIAVAAATAPAIEFGTAVIPIQPRHPQALAGQALTAQAATGGRLTLGIGLSHQFVVEHLWGLPFDRPVRHMREYLEALGPLLQGENSDVHGELVTSAGAIGVSDATAPPVLVAALGEQMLKVAGRLADGTITWCTGPKTLKDHIVPTIAAAAEAAGRPAPRIVASLPIVLTDEPVEAKAFVASSLELYGTLPSYRAMLDREGAADPSDIAIVGNEDQAAEAFGSLAEAGVTDFGAAEMGRNPDEAARTREFLKSQL
ncbi:MAG TPA: TIGR03564 family F420-dependent LLM class oxidoreductase [Acidimicrobiales bacterium]